jgi:hypothetical protein
VLAALPALALAQAPPDGWADATEIRFAGLPEGPVPNLIVPIRLAQGSTFDHAAAAALGADLRFVDRQGTELPYEIESWDPNGVSVVWVRVAWIDGADDQIWLYSGNPAAPPVEDPAATWSGWDVVLHLDDLTRADGGGLQVEGDPARVQGLVGDGRELHDDDALVGAAPGHDPRLTVVGALRMDPQAYGYWRTVLARRGYTIGRCFGGGLGLYAWDDAIGPLDPCSPAPVDDGRWHAFGVTVGYGAARVYVDGVVEDERPAPEADLWSDPGFRVGGSWDGTDSLDGALDELRISPHFHSARWVAADAAALQGTLVRLCNRWTGDVWVRDQDGDGAYERDGVVACDAPGVGWVRRADQPTDCDDRDRWVQDRCRADRSFGAGRCQSAPGMGWGLALAAFARRRRR